MSDMSLFQHWSTLNAIDRAGDRMHAGLMSLATAQAGAMQRLGAQLDDGLVRIDQSMMAQNEELNRISGVLDGVRKDMREGFGHIEVQMSGINNRLDRIETKVSNPEETRALERFSRAVTLLKKGYPADALENLKAAIENDGGPALRHIPKFQLMLGVILIGDTQPQADDLIDYQAAHCAFRQASLHLTGEQAAIALCRAGAAAFLDGDDDLAIDTYLDALQIVDEKRVDCIKSAEDYFEIYRPQNRYQAQMFDQVLRELGPGRYTHYEDVAETLQKHLGPGYKDYERATEKIRRVIDLDRYTRFELAKSYLNKGDQEAAAEHLRRAIDQDWSMVALVAADPCYQKHAAWAEALIGEYRNHVLRQLESTLPALAHLCTGPTERNFGKIADRIQEEACKISLDDLDPDLEGNFSRPSWGYGHGFNSDKRRAVEGMLNALRNEGIGLIDITDILERKGWYKFLHSCVKNTKWDLDKLENDLDFLKDIRSDSTKFSANFFKIYSTNEAKERASDSGARKPGLLGRLSGKRPARSHDELKDLERRERVQLSVLLSEPLKPEIESFRDRHQRSSDIYNKAYTCLRLLDRYRTGQPLFFSPLADEVEPSTPSLD